MKKLGYTLIALSAISVAAASAQEPGKTVWDRIVLEDKTGVVMTSMGGDYKSAQVGEQLAVGEHMLLGDLTKAKIVYYDLDDNGKVINRCVKDYTDPNTYIIDATCKAGAVWAAGGTNNAASVGIIVGAAVLAAALINAQDDAPQGPLSDAVRRP